MKNIYGKFLKRKQLYYFLKYYNIIATIRTNNFINSKLIDKNNNRQIPLMANDYDKKKIMCLSNNNRYIYNINNTKLIPPHLNTSIPLSLALDNYSFLSKTERIPKKIKYHNSNNYKKINRNFPNNFENDNFLKKNRTRTKVSIPKKLNKFREKGGKCGRNLSYGHIEKKKEKKNKEVNKMNVSKSNYNIFDNSNLINNTQSIKAIYPSYTITSPNGLLYPIFFASNNDNFINNNNLNNNILFNCQGTTIANNDRKLVPKPSLWYTNVFSPISQIPIVQNNNYTISKYLNNSTNFNSVQNLVDNNYSEEYLNKQILDFINANNKIKQNIITNIGKKHNMKLSKSNGTLKIKNKTNKIYDKKLSKTLKRRNNSQYSMYLNDSNHVLSERINKGKSYIISKDQRFDKYNKNQTSFRNEIEINDMSDSTINNNMNSPSSLLINNYNKENQNLKKSYYQKIYSNNSKNNKNEKKIKKNIYHLKNKFDNENINKIIRKNLSNEFNKKLKITQKEYSYYTEKANKKTNNNFQNNNYNLNNLNNEKEISEPVQNIYKGYSNSHIIPLYNNKPNIKTNYNYNSLRINNNNNNINKKDQKQKKNNLNKNDKINFNIQNISKETYNPKIKYPYNQNISISSLGSNDNIKTSKFSFPPRPHYEIINVVDEKFINKKNFEEKEKGQNLNFDDSLEMSLQSVNDSKMLELANRYIEEGKSLDKNKINDILNNKSCQKKMKKNIE